MKFIFNLFLFVAVAGASSAAAQVYVPPVGNSTYTAIIQGNMQTMDLSQRVFNSSQALATGGGGRRGRGGVGRSRNAAPSITTFRPVAASIVPRQLAAVFTNDPAKRREREAFFQEQLKIYESRRLQFGQPVKDVAHALGYFLVINYNATQGREAATEQDAAAVREQFRALFINDAKFKALTDRDKQVMYETAAILARFTVFGYEAAEQAGDQPVMRQFKDMARRNLEQYFGVPVERIRFTNRGVEVR